MRLSITIIFLSCMSLVMGQTNKSSSKLEEGERKRLENQFKALKNFYINDQGLVVYQIQGNDAKLVKEEDENVNNADTLSATTDDSTDYSVSSEDAPESENLAPQPIKTEDPVSKEDYASSYSSPVNSSSSVVSINKRPKNPVFENRGQRNSRIEKVETSETLYSEAKTKPDDIPVTTSKIIAIPPATKMTEPAPVSHKQEVMDTLSVADDEEADEEDGVVILEPSRRKSVFEKDPSKFKSLEEAAMAAQDLLDKLKSEQSRTTSSGSLSSRLSKGAGNSSLKKNQSSLGGVAGKHNRPIISDKTIEAEKTFEEANTSYAVDPTPTYYINGVEVDKSVVDKLKKGDIFSREIRSRNSQSGNPAGEVWIQLK